MSCREQERSALCINANCREANQSTGRGVAANLGVVHHSRAVTLHTQMQVLSQAVTQRKPKLMTWCRQLVRKPHCFSAETLPVKYYLDRKAAADWGMLICTNFSQASETLSLFTRCCSTLLLILQRNASNEIHLFMKPATGRQILHREAPGFQGVETFLGFNKCCARQLSRGNLHTSSVGLASHKQNWGNNTIYWTLTAQLKGAHGWLKV